MQILLIAYDNGSYIHHFPLGLAYVAAVLRNKGYDVDIYQQDKHHYSEEHLTEYLNVNTFDVIGIGIIAGYYQYRKLLKISEAINNSKNRPFYLIAGHGPSADPEFFLRKTQADAVVIGEGEETIIDLMAVLNSHGPLHTVQGIAFQQNGSVVVNERRPLIADIDSIPFPAYDLFPIDYYRMVRIPCAETKDFIIPVISGRGCKFQCNFCYRMDKGFRIRRAENIAEEIRFLNKDYSINYIIFYDELLMISEQRTVELCRHLIKSKLKIKWWCNGRLNYAKPEVLKMMKKAGCVFINYGIEAMDDQVLKSMKKNLTTKQIIRGIEATLAEGIKPGFNIIFGNIGDNRETIKKGVEFLLRYDDGAQMRTIRPVTPYPGSPLYDLARERGLLKDCEDFYENKHLNSDLLAVNFTEMSDDEVYDCLLAANYKLIKNFFDHKCGDTLEQCNKLYIDRDTTFRGFRQT